LIKKQRNLKALLFIFIKIILKIILFDILIENSYKKAEIRIFTYT